MECRRSKIINFLFDFSLDTLFMCNHVDNFCVYMTGDSEPDLMSDMSLPQQVQMREIMESPAYTGRISAMSRLFGGRNLPGVYSPSRSVSVYESYFSPTMWGGGGCKLLMHSGLKGCSS